MDTEQIVASKEEFDEAIDKILSSSKYWRFNNEISKTADSLLEKFYHWLEEAIASRINGIENAPQISKVLSIGIIIVIGIILMIAIGFIIKFGYEWFTGREKLEEILGEKITKETTPSSLRAKAKSYEEEGSYRLSIRYSYIGLLLLMHEKGILYIESSMTNAEIYQYLKKESYDKLDLFKQLAEVFDYTWYGENECDQAGYEHYMKYEEKLWIEVTSYEKNHR